MQLNRGSQGAQSQDRYNSDKAFVSNEQLQDQANLEQQPGLPRDGINNSLPQLESKEKYAKAISQYLLNKNIGDVKMPSIAHKLNLRRASDQNDEFELYEGSARYKAVQSVNIVDKFIEQRQQQQLQSESNRFSNKLQNASPFQQQYQNQSNSKLNPNQSVPRNNFHSNDTNVLQARLAELEAELQSLDQEYEGLQLENEELKEQHEDIKSKNKALFEQITSSHEHEDSTTIKNDTSNNQTSQDDTNIGEIHSLYQDLFLTDIKKEVESAQTELKQCKQEQNTTQREMTNLKKENQQLTATLKRYRKMLQEMTNNKKDDLNINFMSPTDLHKMHMMSFESVEPNAAALMQQQPLISKIDQGPKNQLQNLNKLKRSDSGTSSTTNLVSQATYIETAKIERLLAALMTIQNAEKVYEILMTALKELKILITCQNCTIFVMSQELQKSLVGVEKTQNINMQKFTMDGGRWVDALCENDKELSQPGFKKPEDIRYGLKTQQFLAYPVMFREDDIIVVIQCEAKFNKKANKYMGFQVADEQVLKIFCYYLQMRFERRVALREVKQREQAVVDTLKLTSEICTQRHHDGLFRKMKENLPEFFGFESVGVLIYNFKTNWLFTDPDQVKEHKSHNAMQSQDMDVDDKTIESQPQKSYPKTPIEPIDNLTEEEKLLEEMAKIKEVHQKKFMNFPCNSGISGIVFQTGQIYISNNAAKETKFIDEIDNQSSITDVRNFMIGPVYGEKKDAPCGIIQFVNKEKGQQITASDENKFKAMQGLLGMCIDNTNEMSLTINVTLDVHDVMQKIQDIMKRESQADKEHEESEARISNLTDHIKSIKETYNKLIDDRTKAKTAI